MLETKNNYNKFPFINFAFIIRTNKINKGIIARIKRELEKGEKEEELQ